MSQYPPSSPENWQNDIESEPQGGGMAIASLVLGIISLVAWCCPLIGVPISVVGLILGIKSKEGANAGMAKAGLIMSIIGLILSIGNAILGVILQVTGNQQPLFGP